MTSNYDKDDSLSPIYTATPLGPSNGGGGGIGQISTESNSHTANMYACMVPYICFYSPITDERDGITSE
jgi:hypothetical protein